MRYVLLIYGSEALPQEKRAAIMRAHPAFLQELQQRGLLTGGAALQATSSATTVRVRDGKTIITDGPFAETKEQLAGFYILDCKELDEAIAMAASRHRYSTGARQTCGCRSSVQARLERAGRQTYRWRL